MGRAKFALLWLVTILQAAAMTGSGIQKFTSPAWERMFRTWGYPDHFYLIIGAVETAGGLCLLVPRLASPAALTLAVVMLGAAITQMTRGGRNGVGELVFMAMLLVIAYARWPATIGALRSRLTRVGAGE